MAILGNDIAAFEAMRSALEASSPKAWVVFHGGAYHGQFPDFEAAANFALGQFGQEPSLIRQLGAPPSVHLTGGMIFTPSHALSSSRV
jgi:hypothetical protein